MELFTILLSVLLTIVSPGGLLVESRLENSLRSRLGEVEQIAVRVDNTPSYNYLQGEIDRVRIATRGVLLAPDLRIEALELETDPLKVDLQRLRQGNLTALNEVFQEPLQAGVRLVLTEADLNQALTSPAIMALLQDIVTRLGARLPGNFGQRYQLANPEIELLEQGRVRFTADLNVLNAQGNIIEKVQTSLETAVEIVAGQQLRLVNTNASINGIPLPPPLVNTLTQGIGDRFNIRLLENFGIQARLLDLDINANDVEIASFIQVNDFNALPLSTIGEP